ncbi:MAG: 50S ribosomal protein L13 [Candidatus Neomarinimicrobiota bacterium]|nr:50S ribosomal protein L13 [Candidatus Neomarinimicrobiota bacterium]
MKTLSIKQSEIEKNWWVADAEGQVLGRFASRIAQVLRGKHKVNFTPHMDMGDCVVVINAEKVYLSGNKETKKTYFRHTGYPGGGKETTLDHLRHTYPERIVTNAIKGMLPHNRLGLKVLSHLKVYAGTEHPHHAQQPQELKV